MGRFDPVSGCGGTWLKRSPLRAAGIARNCRGDESRTAWPSFVWQGDQSVRRQIGFFSRLSQGRKRVSAGPSNLARETRHRRTEISEATHLGALVLAHGNLPVCGER